MLRFVDRWAFVDFASTEGATDALVNPKNHFLDGRKLVIEYASPDAVRRGGNIPRSKDKDRKDGGPGAKGRGPQPRADCAHAHREAPGADRKRKVYSEDADAAEEVTDREDASRKKRRTEDGYGTRSAAGKDKKPARARPKPGAALALAKRETAAIVPSQGQKIVF